MKPLFLHAPVCALLTACLLPWSYSQEAGHSEIPPADSSETEEAEAPTSPATEEEPTAGDQEEPEAVENLKMPDGDEFILPDGRSVPVAETLDADRVKLGKVIINHKERSVSFTAFVNMNEGLIEYICCMPNGKVHESFLVTNADPLHVSLGMTLLKFHRFEKFFPERDENFEWLPFTEPRPEDYKDCFVQIAFAYQDENGDMVPSSLSDFIINSQTGQGIDGNDWLYTNSFFYEGAYQASLSGEVISVFASRTSPINYIGDFNDGDNNNGWIVNPKKKIPVGTKVTITITQKSSTK